VTLRIARLGFRGAGATSPPTVLADAALSGLGDGHYV
jgi:hypothetical protein